ncbi:MAG: hypothetical protein P8X74_01275 [Reinekea sp.]
MPAANDTDADNALPTNQPEQQTYPQCADEPVPTGISSNPCQILNWQHYLTALLTASEQERAEQRNSLTASETDHLRRLLLNSLPGQSLQQRMENQIMLFDYAAKKNGLLKGFIFNYAQQNQTLLEQELSLIQIVEQSKKQQQQIQQLQQSLQQTQDKIEALTKIEQQLDDNIPETLETESNE